jgi:hypothetical protein
MTTTALPQNMNVSSIRAFGKILFLFGLLSIYSADIIGQGRQNEGPVTFEELFDEPYEINKLFVQFQPLYGDLFVTNVNAGFGIEATYYHGTKWDFRAHARKTYTKKFDLARDIAEKNSDMDNAPGIFNYYELGATYHIKDFDESSKTKMILYKKSYKGNRWSARMPKEVEIPSKLRKIYGARVGGFAFDTSTDLNRAMDKQGLERSQLVDADGNAMGEDLSVFGNVAVSGFYIGTSLTRIRNVAVEFDNNYAQGVDDLIFNAFFDIMVGVSRKIDNVFYNGVEFDSGVIKTNALGFRLGMDGKFNRTLGWGYGAEMGYRPGIQGRNFFALVKISFPVYSTNLNNKVEAFGK